jgi:hypothetical protein
MISINLKQQEKCLLKFPGNKVSLAGSKRIFKPIALFMRQC